MAQVTDFKKALKDSRARRAALLASLGGKPFEAKTKWGWVFAHRDSREPGKPWRLSLFGDDRKPTGHSNFSSFEELVGDLAAYGVHDASQVRRGEGGWSLNPKRFGIGTLKKIASEVWRIGARGVSVEVGNHTRPSVVFHGRDWDLSVDSPSQDFVFLLRRLSVVPDGSGEPALKLILEDHINDVPLPLSQRALARIGRQEVASEAKKRSAKDALAELKAERALRTKTAKRLPTDKAAAKKRAASMDLDDPPYESGEAAHLREAATEGARHIELNNNPARPESHKQAEEVVRKLGPSADRIARRFGVALIPENLIECGQAACAWGSGRRVVKVTLDHTDAYAALALREIRKRAGLPKDILDHLVDVLEVCRAEPFWIIAAEFLEPLTPGEVTAIRHFHDDKYAYWAPGAMDVRHGSKLPVRTELQHQHPKHDWKDAPERAHEAWSALVRLDREHQISLWRDAHGANWGRGRDGKIKLLDFGYSAFPSSLQHIPDPCDWSKEPEKLRDNPYNFYPNPLDPVCGDVGRAYLATPDVSATKRAKELYAQYARETAALWQLLRLRVDFTTDDPYKTAAEMRESVERTKVMRIFSGGAEHPLLTPEQNLRGRAVHDLLAHLVCGCPFTATGEYNAFEAQAALYSVELRSLLFTEIVGQSCAYVLQKGTHAEQKVVFLPEALVDRAASMRRNFRGLGLAGVIERGWIDPAVLAIAEGTGYALRYAYAVLENKPVSVAASNPAWSKRSVTEAAPKWARWI